MAVQLPAQISEAYDHLVVLAVSGAGGAFFRAIVAPEQAWRRRVLQGVAGALSAIFLGGLAANTINGFMNAGVYSYLGAGFLMGSGGEVLVKVIQDKILGVKTNA